MHGSYPGTSKFSNNTFDNHWHINNNSVSRLNSKISDKTMSKFRNSLMKVFNSYFRALNIQLTVPYW